METNQERKTAKIDKKITQNVHCMNCPNQQNDDANKVQKQKKIHEFVQKDTKMWQILLKKYNRKVPKFYKN